ncbi:MULTISPECIES: N-acetyltransferase [Bacillaceae]|uniref:GNAT family N-acetyltransferase n=1 Tax=Bacillaceae TaxID=186817 RepID=UPI002A0D60D8|nr:N-acetyltransferase [Cytobacillus sp. IB215316]MDX8362739.1 N-acetyltransferase [Cytobacillus sp. IB215316]
MDIVIKEEISKEYNMTEEIVKRAFLNVGDKKEHILVNRIRKSNAFIPELSLVAKDQNNDIVGHILLSKITIGDGDNTADSLALAPLCVVPEYQNKGIGSQLIHAALKNAKELGYGSVIVLGHKDYYPKFGFKPASLWNIKAPFEVPDEVYMALEITENSLENVQGIVYYSSAFSD